MSEERSVPTSAKLAVVIIGLLWGAAMFALKVWLAIWFAKWIGWL